jgi:hypothetical protein
MSPWGRTRTVDDQVAHGQNVPFRWEANFPREPALLNWPRLAKGNDLRLLLFL